MRRALELYYRFLKLALTVLMFLLVVPVTLQIVSSYVPFVPRYIWTEEMARFCFIWIILIGAIIAMREGTHFTVDLLPPPATRRAEGLRNMFVDFNIFLVALVFILWGKPLVEFGLLQTSEMAELPMVLIYSAWPLAGASWILFLIEKTADNIKLVRSPEP